jgi:hypothetical protein
MTANGVPINNERCNRFAELPGELGIRVGFAFIDLWACTFNTTVSPGAAIESGTWAVAIAISAVTPTNVNNPAAIWSVTFIAASSRKSIKVFGPTIVSGAAEDTKTYCARCAGSFVRFRSRADFSQCNRHVRFKHTFINQSRTTTKGQKQTSP